MSRLSLRPIVATAFAAAVCFAMSAYPGASNAWPVERLVAMAVSMSPLGPETDGRVEIVIEHWSTDQERDSLRGTLERSGPDMLLGALQKLRIRAGFVQVPGQLGSGARARLRRALNIQFAREIKTATGRQVIVALDGPWNFHAGGRPTAVDGPAFTLLDIRLGPDGNGVGKLSPASQVTYNKATGTIELANFATEPVRLKDVASSPLEARGESARR
jgi:hypothetical protein